MSEKLKIITAAKNIFADRGFDGTSIRMIADKAGVNSAMISYYFGSKEGLFKSIAINRIDEVRDILLSFQNEEMNEEQKIHSYVDTLVSQFLADPVTHIMIIREISTCQRSELSLEIASRLAENLSLLGVSDLFSTQSERDFESRMLVFSIIGTLFHLINMRNVMNISSNVSSKGEAMNLKVLEPLLKNYFHNLITRFFAPYHE